MSIIAYVVYKLKQGFSKGKIQEWIVKNNCINFNQQSNAKFDKSLRGGGAICASNKVYDPQSEMMTLNIPEGFDENIKKHSLTIIEQIPIQFTGSDTLIAFQWFLHNEGYFWVISDSNRLVPSYYLLCFKTLEEFLSILPNYLNCSGYLFYQLLKICNYLMYVIVKYQFFNEKRFLDDEKKQELKIQIGNLENQIKIEMSKVWETGVLFELQLLKTALTHLRTNSTQGRDIFMQFVAGLATSLASFKLSDELKDALKVGAKFLFIKLYEEQIQNPIEVYKIFQFFKGLKWKILFQLGKKSQVYQMIAQLKEGYNQNLKNSKNWIIHYCWVEMISELLIYRPIIHQNSMLISEWSQLLLQKSILPLPYNKREASVNITVRKESMNQNIKFSSIDYFEFVVFKTLLLDDSLSEKNEIQLWNQYLKFEFKIKKPLISGSQLDDLHNLVNLNQSFLQSLIQQCKQNKTNFLFLCQQKYTLLEWYEKNQMQSSKQILIHDLNLTFAQLEVTLENYLISINELLHCFSFQAQKIKVFLKILENNSIKQKSTSIESQLNEISVHQKTILEQLTSSWQQIISQIINEQLNYIVLGNFNFADQLTEKSGTINSFFDQTFILENMNKVQLKISEQCNNLFLEFKDKLIQNQLDLSDIMNSLLTVHTVPVFSSFANEIYTNSHQTSVNNLIKFNSFDWKFDELQELQKVYRECGKLSKGLKILRLFLNIQNTKQYQLKQYLQSINDDFDNQNSNYLNSEQSTQVMNAILKEQKKYIQSILNIPNSQDVQAITKQVEYFEEQLSQTKNFIKEKQFSENLKTKILIFDRTISLKLNLLILFQDDWKDHKTNLLKEYDKFINEVNLESQQQNQNEQKQSQLVQAIEEIISQLDNKSYKNEKKQSLQQQKEWIIVQNDISKMIQIILNSQDKKNLISNDSEMNSFIQQISLKTSKLLHTFQKISQQQFNLLEQSNKFQLSINLFTNVYEFSIQLIQQVQQSELKSENEYENFLFQILQNEISNAGNNKNIFSKMFENKSYRVRECLLFNLIKMQADSQDPGILKFVQTLIKQIWVYEKDQNVRVLLNNREMIQMQQKIFSFELKSFSDQLQQDMKDKMKEIEKLEQDARLEGESHKGEEFETLLKQKYDEFEQIFDNVSEMQDKIGLNLIFLKEIGKDIKVIKNKIDKLQDAVNIIGSDVRKLRGKNFQELLQLRMEKVLQEKRLRDLDSVYVEVKTKEIDPETGQNIKSQNGLVISSLFKENFDNFDGEINEFLWDEKEKNKDVFLLKGQAGSGKSRAAKMIEEFIWEQSMVSKQNKIKWIPIFISLPQIKDPKYNLFSEGLQQENYQFDQFQIKELLEAIQKDEINILLILDSYDEMNSQNIESNLYQTNKFNQEFSIQVSGMKLKIIITVRTEILKQQTYQNLFYGTSLKNLKEVELLPFTTEQGQEYLKQFCTLNVKRQIKKLYDFARQARSLKFDVEEFLQIMKQINKILKQKETLQQDEEKEFSNDRVKDSSIEQENQISENQQVTLSVQDQLSIMQNSEIQNFFDTKDSKQQTQHIEELYQNPEMLTDLQIEVILKTLKKDQLFDKMNESAFLALQKDLASIWSQSKFAQTIENIKINHLLQTPFMMEIVVQVLPLIVVIFSDREIVYKQFCENFKKLKMKGIISNMFQKKQISKFENNQLLEHLTKNEQDIVKHLSQTLQILEGSKFFQNYSLSDQITIKNNSLIFKKQSIYLNDLETADIVVKSLKMRQITVFDFYQTFANYYSESQLQKWRNLGKVNNSESLLIDFSEYQESLALDMTLRQLTQITYKNKGKLQLIKAQTLNQQQVSWEDQYFDSFGDQNYQKILRSCILLTSNGSTFSFNHKSIQEFYVGKYILDFLNKIDEQVNQEVILHTLYNQNLFNLSQMQYQGTIRLIFDKLNQIPLLKEKLMFVINLSKKNKTFLRASSNCFFLCMSQKINLINEDLQNINIGDISIEGLSLHNCNLNGSNFDNVAIDSCNFNICNLQNVDWKNIIYNETKILKGHKNSVTLIAFSQNKYIASSSYDGIIYLWNAEEAKMISQFDCKIKEIESIAFSTNGQFLAINRYNIIQLWNTQEINQPIQVGQMELMVRRVYFTNNDKTLVSVFEGQVFTWDVEKIIQSYKPEVIIEISNNNFVSAQSFSKDGKYLIVGLSNGNLSVYNCLNNYNLITQLQKHKKKVNVVSFSDKETVFITAGMDQTLNVWLITQQEDFQILNSIQYYGSDFKKILYNSNFSFLLVLSDDYYIHKLNLEQKELDYSSNFEVQDLNFSFDQIASNQLGSMIAINQENQQNVIIQQINNDLKSFQQIGIIKLNADKLESMIFSNSKFLALIFKTKIEIWNIKELQISYELKIDKEENYFIQLIFSPDENQIFISQSDGLVKVFELSDIFHFVHQRNIIEGDNSFYKTNILQYSHNNLFILIGRKDGSIKIIEKQMFNEIIFISLKKELVEIQFYIDDSFLIIGQKNQIDIISFFDNMKQYKTSLLYLCESQHLGFTQIQRNDTLMAIFSNKIIVWNKLQNQQQDGQKKKLYQINYIWAYKINIYAILSQHNAIICRGEFQKDENKTDQLYNLVKLIQTKQQIHLIEGHTNIIKDLDYSNNYLYFVSVDQEKSIIRNSENMEIIKILQFGACSVQFYKENILILDNPQFGIIISDWQLNENNYNVIYKMIQFDGPIHSKDYKSSIYSNERQIFFSCAKRDYSEIHIWETNDFQVFEQSYFIQNTDGQYQEIHVNMKNQEISIQNKIKNKIIIKSIQNNGIQKLIYQCMDGSDCIVDCLFTQERLIFLADETKILLYSEDQKLINQYLFEEGKKVLKIQFLNKQLQLIILLKDCIQILNYCEVINNLGDVLQPTLYHIFQLNDKLREIFVNENTQILISFSNLNVLIWDISAKYAYPLITAHPLNIFSLAFSANGETFATGSEDKNIKIWNIKSCQQIQSNDSHQDRVDQLAFKEENLTLISHSKDNTIKFWDIQYLQKIQTHCDIFKFFLHQNMLMIQTSNFKLLYSNIELNQKYVYLELFNSIDLEIYDRNAKEFQLLKNGHQLTIFNEKGNFIYEVSDQLVFNLVDDYYNSDQHKKKISKIILNLRQSEDFITFSDKYISIHEPPLRFKGGLTKYQQQGILIELQIEEIIYNKNQIIVRFKDCKEINVYENISKYFKENKKITFNKHEYPIISMTIYEINLVSLDDDGKIIFWNLQEYQYLSDFDLKKYTENYEKCLNIEFSQSGRMLATGHEKGLLIVWNVENQKAIKEIKKFFVPKLFNVEFIQFLPSDKIVACLCNEFIWFFQLQSQEDNKIMRSTFKCSKQFTFLQNYPYVFCIKHNQLKAFYILDSFNCQHLTIDDEIGARKFSKSYNLLVYSNEENQIKLFDMKNLKLLNSIHYEITPKYLLISQSEKIIVSLNTQDQIECWVTQTFDSIEIRNINQELNKGITCVEMTPDSQLLVFANKNLELYLLMIETNETLLNLRNFNYHINSICFTQNLQIFALGFSDGTIKIYSFNYKNLDPVSQLNDSNFQLDFKKEPICIKIFGRTPELLAYGCQINQSIIQNQQQQSLLEVFKLKQYGNKYEV